LRKREKEKKQKRKEKEKKKKERKTYTAGFLIFGEAFPSFAPPSPFND